METWKVILQTVTTLGALVGVLWTIVWAIRRPKLTLSLLHEKALLTTFGHGQSAPPAYFYHLRASNMKRWPATGVRVKVITITKECNGKVCWELRTPVCLIWATRPSPKLYALDVVGLDEEACNLGYIKNDPKYPDMIFQLDAIDPPRNGQEDKWPPNFQGFVRANEKLRVELVAVAENARSNTLGVNLK